MWRAALAPRRRVDALDAQTGRWFAATVVGARAASPPARPAREVRIHYDGFSAGYDEWVSVHSTRLARPGTRKKKKRRR